MRQQCDAPADLFGELALQAGYLTPADLTSLVQEQAQRGKTFEDVLVELELLTPESLAEHYGEFRRAMQPADDRQPVGAEA
jgi:hypothetical protein